MKEMILKAREEKKGFTLAELLIVVAIIAVLVAIAIPVFSSQLENSREATDKANIRSAYAQVVTAYLSDSQAHSVDVAAQQTQDAWQSDGGDTSIKIGTDLTVSGVSGTGGSSVDVTAKTSGKNYTVKISSTGTVSVE